MDPTPREPDDELDAAASGAANPAGEILRALPWMSRLVWFGLGALVATAVTVLAFVRPWQHPRAERAEPYEGFPFADNAGVCQEFVALATLRTSHTDAQGIAQRLSAALPASLRPGNVRVVRAFAPGDVWTLAVDAESGTGTMARAATVATELNAVPGTGLVFEPVFYSSRRLYDTAQVLCMPRATSTAPATADPR